MDCQVPDAALRYTPPAPPKAKASASPFMPMTPPRPTGPRRAGGAKADAALGASRSGLWVLENGAPKRVFVETGGSDGQNTEIKSGPIQPGTVVITDQEQAKAP